MSAPDDKLWQNFWEAQEDNYWPAMDDALGHIWGVNWDKLRREIAQAQNPPRSPKELDVLVSYLMDPGGNHLGKTIEKNDLEAFRIILDRIEPDQRHFSQLISNMIGTYDYKETPERAEMLGVILDSIRSDVYIPIGGWADTTHDLIGHGADRYLAQLISRGYITTETPVVEHLLEPGVRWFLWRMPDLWLKLPYGEVLKLQRELALIQTSLIAALNPNLAKYVMLRL